jgi:hypothetical protein
MLAKLVALVIHEVVTEYRKLDRAAEGADDRRYDVASTTAAEVERAAGREHEQPPAAAVAFGFGSRERGPLH